jgi:chemotaxis protein MotB
MAVLDIGHAAAMDNTIPFDVHQQKRSHTSHGDLDDDDHEGGHREEGESWLMSFADLILNLLLFFIVLYAISNVDQKKLQELAEAINGEQVPQTTVRKAESSEENGEVLQEIQTLMQKLNPDKETAKQNQKANEIKSKLGEMFSLAPGKDKENDLFEVVLAGERYFNKGQAELTESGKSAVQILAQRLKPISGDISLYIEGHAAPQEVSQTDQGAGAWRLASERAANALMELQKYKLNLKQISTAGFGDQVNLTQEAIQRPKNQGDQNTLFQRARVHLRVVREVKE